MSLIAIRDKALEIALTQDGVKEKGGNNRGPDVEKYLAAVGLGPGFQWCCAFVIWCYREATIRSGGGLELPLRRTGKVARLWELAKPLWKSNKPSRGAVYVHLANPADPDTEGHCGIVLEHSDRSILAIEGNTNAAGSRLGDRVRIHPRPTTYVHGYIDIGREGPVDSPRIT